MFMYVIDTMMLRKWENRKKGLRQIQIHVDGVWKDRNRYSYLVRAWERKDELYR